jgi:hypothetical protein
MSNEQEPNTGIIQEPNTKQEPNTGIVQESMDEAAEEPEVQSFQEPNTN